MEFKEGTKVKKIYDSFVKHQKDGDFSVVLPKILSETGMSKGYVAGYVAKWMKVDKKDFTLPKADRKVNDSEKVEKFVMEMQENLKAENKKFDFYFRTGEEDTEKVKLISENSQYRIIEFEGGELKGTRRQIPPNGVPIGKRYPVLFKQDKGKGNPKLFSINGKALVVKDRNPETEAFIPDVDKNYFFDKQIASNVIESIALGQTIALQGEVGCGKTSLITQIAAKTNSPVIRINFNGNTTPEDFIGKMHFNPEKGSYWIDGDLPRGCRIGAFILLDELDFIQPEYGARMHKVLEEAENGNGGQKYISLPENNGENVPISNETRFIATGNALFGDAKDRRGVHVGTQDIGAAFEDRFARIFDIGYMEKKKESIVVKKKTPGLKRKHLNSIIEVANMAREAFNNGELLDPFSTRRCLQWAKKVVFSKNLKEAAELSFLPKLRGDDKAAIINFIAVCSKE